MMPVQVRRREQCRLCDGRSLECVVPFAPTPVAEKYLTGEELGREKEVYPLDLYMCRDCGHVQLLDILDPEFLFDNYTYQSAGTLMGHFQKYAEKIVKAVQPPEGALVVDIGSNDGGFLKCFQACGFRVLGIDPAREIARKAALSGVETIPEFLTKGLSAHIRESYGEAHIVAANNVFAHADDLSGMADCIGEMLSPTGVFVFEASYLMDVIERLLLGTIFHEHLSYHSVRPLIGFFDKHGLELIDIERVSIQGGSIIGTVQRKGGPRSVSGNVNNILKLESDRNLDKVETLRAFSSRLQQVKKNLHELMRSFISQGHQIAGFGAARSGTTLISQLEIADMLSFIVDDNPAKQGKYSPGDLIPVLPTKALCEKKPAYVFILAWVHAKKIIENNLQYLEQGGLFIVCFPEIKIIGRGETLQYAGMSSLQTR